MNDNSAPEPDPTAADAAETTAEEPRRSPAVIATAVALPIALLTGIVVAAVMVSRDPVTSPVGLGPVPAPEAESGACTDLLAALPEDMGDFARAELADPAPVGAAAWQAADASEVVVRCGLDRPAEFDQAAALQIIDGVQWFEVSLIPETLTSTTLGFRTVGERVNIETDIVARHVERMLQLEGKR